MNPENEPLPPHAFTAAPPRSTPLSSLSLDDLILLNEEIAGMARAGLPLDKGLSALAAEMGGGKLRTVTEAIARDLKTGSTLPEAIEKQAGRLPRYYARLMAAGIRTGKVSDVLSTLTAYAHTLAELRSTLIGALLYPTIVLVLSLGLFFGVGFFLVPEFEKLCLDLKIRLPTITEVVFHLFHHGIIYFVAIPAGLIGVVFLVWAILRTSERGRITWARFLYAIPLTGVLLRSARLAAFTDLLGILVDNGVPLPEAIQLVGEASNDPMMAAGSRAVYQGLSQGQPLGDVLRKETMLPELVAWMIGLGERRGTLGPTLHQVAQTYRRQVEMRATVLRNVLPSLLVLLIAGAVVFVLAIALLSPFIALLEGLGGGGGGRGGGGFRIFG